MRATNPTALLLCLVSLTTPTAGQASSPNAAGLGGGDRTGAGATARPWVATTGGPDVERIEDVALRAGGHGYYVAGTSFPPAAPSDGWLVRLTPGGRARWGLTLGGPEQDELRAVAPTSDGGLLAAGLTRSFGAGGADGWLVRLDAAGRVLWQRAYGEAGEEVFLGLAASDQGFYVGGTREGGRSGLDLWLLHVDADGGILWQASYGGALADDLSALAAAPGGLVVVSSSRSGLGGASVANFRPWVLRLDGQGNPLWQRTFDYSGGDSWNDIVPLPGGGFVATGEILETAFFRGDAWVVRLDDGGDVVWDQRFGDSFGNLWVDAGERVLPGPDGGVVVLGTTGTAGAGSEDVWWLEVDADGNLLRDVTWGEGGYEEGIALARTEGSGFLAAAFAPGFAGEPGNALLLRLDDAGSVPASCGLEHAAAPRVWTSPLLITEPAIAPVSTTAVVVDTQARVRLLPETGGLHCQ